MSAATPTELRLFHEFIVHKLDNGGDKISPENALEMFRDKVPLQRSTSSADALAAEDTTTWTDEKNQRRYDLVDREIIGAITSEERAELDKLQAEMLAYRRRVAPLPLDDLRKLHDELLKKAAGNSL